MNDGDQMIDSSVSKIASEDTVTVAVSMTVSQREILRKAASKMGLKISPWIRHCAMRASNEICDTKVWQQIGAMSERIDSLADEISAIEN